VRPQRLDWLVGAAVVLACGVGILVFLQGPQPFDPATYFDAAMVFPGGGLNLFSLRIGLTIPVWIVLQIAGPSEFALYAIPVASGALLGGAVYGTMVVLFRDRVLAAGAALVTVLNAAYLLNASAIFPDTTATAIFTASVFCLVLGAQEGRLSARWLSAAAVAAGLLLGWTYLIREFSPVLLPAVIAAVLLLRYPPRRILLVAGAAVVSGSVELIYAAARTGNPFLHASRLLDHEGGGATEGRIEHIQSQLGNPFETLAVFPRLLLAWGSGWLLLGLLALFVVALVGTRDRRLWFFAVWLFSYWLVMALVGLVSLPSGAWVVNITNVRYWYPVFPALAMGGFGGFALLATRFLPHRGVALVPVAAAALTLIVLVPGVVEFKSCEGDPAWRTEPRERWTELRSWFGTPAADRYGELWTDWRTHRLVPAYASTTFGRDLWDGSVSYVLRLDGDPVPPRARSDAAILVHREYLRRDIAELRDDWRPVFATEDGALVVLASGEPGHSASWWTPLPPAPDRADPGTCGVSPYEPG
jgi:hypothetical protein